MILQKPLRDINYPVLCFDIALLQEGWPADNQVSRYARSDSPSRHCITAPRSVLWQPELTPGPIIRSSVEQSIRPARIGLSVLRFWHP